jgi:hypothetical protein
VLQSATVFAGGNFMSDSAPEVRDTPGGDDPRDRIEVFNMDGPADLTVRPMRPHLVRFLREQEERRARLMELWKQQQEQEKAQDAPNAGNGMSS